MASRKDIAAALLARLAPAGGSFPTSGRRLNNPEAAASPGKPAIFLIKPTEHYEVEGEGIPAHRELEFSAIVYTDVGSDESAVPADLCDDLLDAIDAALTPTPFENMQDGGRLTLGGLVYDVRVNGDLDLAPGDVQGKGIMVVPLRVILP